MLGNKSLLRLSILLLGCIFSGNTLLSQQLFQNLTEFGYSGSTHFGKDVCIAGDLNGDGIKDLVIQSTATSFSTGRIYIYYGDDNNGFVTADLILSGDEEFDLTGNSLSTAGDLNGDGFDDLAARRYSKNTESETTCIYFGGKDMDDDVDLVLPGNITASNFDIAGDVNGDGYDDLVTGVPGSSRSDGRIFVYFGGADMDTTVDVILDDTADDSYFGFPVSTGDINGDGYSDILAGAFGYDGGNGRVYIYYGGPDFDTEADLILESIGENEKFGVEAASPGDLNGDGIDDIVIGSYNETESMNNAYIFWGGPDINTSPDLTLDISLIDDDISAFSVNRIGDLNGDGFDDAAIGKYNYNNSTGGIFIFYGGNDMDTDVDIVLSGENEGDNFGVSFSGGDINDDGYSELIAGADGFDFWIGRAYLYYGSTSISTEADFIFDGEKIESIFGMVAGGGDFNGDGYDDVAVGSSSSKRIYVYYGNSSGIDESADVILQGKETERGFGSVISVAGDVNNDGYDDLIAGTREINGATGHAYVFYGGGNMDSVVDVSLEGVRNDYSFGNAVSGAGDVNGDGYDDVIVGTQWHNNVGYAYVYFGGIDMDAEADLTLAGEKRGDRFGYSVSTAGDVNNDGYDDLVIGAPGGDAAYVFWGGTEINTTAGISIYSEENSEYGCAVAGGGDINGDGYDEVLVGENGAGSDGGVYVYFGGTEMDNIADVTFVSEHEDYKNFPAVAFAGDLNKDGFDDVIVGEDGINMSAGRVYVYYGGAVTDAGVDIVIDGKEPNETLGWSISGGGDINGDGDLEIVIGSPYAAGYGKVSIYTFDEATEIESEEEGMPSGFSLSQNYPNPFNPTTSIEYSVSSSGNVSIKVYNMLGQEVMTLVNEMKSPGIYNVMMDGSRLASGVYIYRMTAGSFQSVKKFVLMK